MCPGQAGGFGTEIPNAGGELGLELWVVLGELFFGAIALRLL